MSDRRKIVATALRDMADRLENGKVDALTMQSMVDVMYPAITYLPDGGIDEILTRPKAIWSGIVEVRLPDGTLDV